MRDGREGREGGREREHRTGHRWTDKCNMNVLAAIRERMLSWAGHVARMAYKEICAKALRCRGLQWWRWRQLHWKEVEKDKWGGPYPQWFKIYRWQYMVAGEVSKFAGNADGLSETVQGQFGLIAFCSKPWKLEEPCIDGPGCFGDPSASGTTFGIDGERGDGLTHKIREGRADGLTFRAGMVAFDGVDGGSDGVDGGPDGFGGVDGGFNGVDGCFDGVDGGFDGSDGFDGIDEGGPDGSDGLDRVGHTLKWKKGKIKRIELPEYARMGGNDR